LSNRTFTAEEMFYAKECAWITDFAENGIHNYTDVPYATGRKLSDTTQKKRQEHMFSFTLTYIY